MKQAVFLFITIVITTMNTGCKKPKIPEKKGVHLFYVILDKSSNYFSSTDMALEENYIDIDSSYLNMMIDFIYQSINENETKNDVTLFFNYIDKDVRGNRELILKIEGFDEIDTVYKTGSSVISKRSEFKKTLQQKENARQTALKTFKEKKMNFYKDLIPMLEKSSHTRGSDCSGTLRVADEKLNNYFIDTARFAVKSKWIIAFSDLVNSPSNNTQITLTNRILRPGYSSKLPYLPSDLLINLTTQDEFDTYLQHILNP